MLLPDQPHTRLVAIRRTGPDAEVAWSLMMEGVHSTNLAAVTLSNGMIGVGVGMKNDTLRLWLP